MKRVLGALALCVVGASAGAQQISVQTSFDAGTRLWTYSYSIYNDTSSPISSIGIPYEQGAVTWVEPTTWGVFGGPPDLAPGGYSEIIWVDTRDTVTSVGVYDPILPGQEKNQFAVISPYSPYNNYLFRFSATDFVATTGPALPSLVSALAVPEPETYALLAGGLGIVTFRARRVSRVDTKTVC